MKDFKDATVLEKLDRMIELDKKKEETYKIIKQINENTEFLCAKQFYNYYRRNKQ